MSSFPSLIQTGSKDLSTPIAVLLFDDLVDKYDSKNTLGCRLDNIESKLSSFEAKPAALIPTNFISFSFIFALFFLKDLLFFFLTTGSRLEVPDSLLLDLKKAHNEKTGSLFVSNFLDTYTVYLPQHTLHYLNARS